MSKAEIITKLETARVAMLDAGKALLEEYGEDFERAIEIIQGAAMLEDWIDAIREEDQGI